MLVFNKRVSALIKTSWMNIRQYQSRNSLKSMRIRVILRSPIPRGWGFGSFGWSTCCVHLWSITLTSILVLIHVSSIWCLILRFVDSGCGRSVFALRFVRFKCKWRAWLRLYFWLFAFFLFIHVLSSIHTFSLVDVGMSISPFHLYALTFLQYAQSEFLSGILLLGTHSKDERITATFERFDLNKDGFIDRDEMRQLFRVTVFETGFVALRLLGHSEDEIEVHCWQLVLSQFFHLRNFILSAYSFSWQKSVVPIWLFFGNLWRKRKAVFPPSFTLFSILIFLFSCIFLMNFLFPFCASFVIHERNSLSLSLWFVSCLFTCLLFYDTYTYILWISSICDPNPLLLINISKRNVTVYVLFLLFHLTSTHEWVFMYSFIPISIIARIPARIPLFSALPFFFWFR